MKILKKKKRVYLKSLLHILVFCTSVGMLISSALVVWFVTLPIPNLSSFESRKITQSTKVYDRTGEVLLFDVHQDIKRTIVPSEKISKNIKSAIIAIEDTEFYTHGGIKVTSIIRAILANIFSLEYSQGGSTITQQVVKNALLTTDRTITRKLKEWVLAVKIDRSLPKDQILGVYLNESPFGGNLYGVEEASQTYFAKGSDKVSLAESAYLAALLQAPSYYSPYGKNKEKLDGRQRLVLSRMKEVGFISNDEYELAKKEVVTFASKGTKGIKAPHFVNFVLDDIKKKYGDRIVEDGGLKITTTLDYTLQKKAEDIVAKYGEQNEKQFKAKNAGMVAIDPQNGQILVMVGSRDYFNAEIDGSYNIATALRQPGSSFKPFVYATALKKGFTPETVLFDVETEFSSDCNPNGTPKNPGSNTKCYHPQNYDEAFHGPVTMRQALARSLNIPAIKILYLAGLKDSLRTAKDLGITSLTTPEQYGFSLVLGAGEVSLLEMTNAYSVFANDGIRNPYNPILKIETSDGKVLEDFQAQPERVLESNIAETISDILSDDDARIGTFIRHSLLYFPNRDVAVKTGTTNSYRDAWIVGYTPRIAVGAWVGNNDNSSMERKVAGTIVTPMWHAFMNEAFLTVPDQEFKKPIPEDTTNLPAVLRGSWQGGTSYFVDAISGKLATEFTPPELRQEKYLNDVHDILYFIDKNNPRGPKPEHPEQDSQFYNWEFGVQQYVKAKGISAGGTIPTAVDDIHKPEYVPKISVYIPKQSYTKNERMILSLQYASKWNLARVDYFLNGTFIGSTNKAPFSLAYVLDNTDILKDTNEIRARAYDAVLNSGVGTTTFSVVQ